MNTANDAYLPILKAKRGEFLALSNLSVDIRNIMKPFFDIPRPDKKQELKEYLNKKAQDIEKYWGAKRPLFVDLFDFDLTVRASSGQHYVDLMFNSLNRYRVQAIPATGLDRDNDYNTEIARVIRQNGSGVAIRLQREDIEDPHGSQAGIGNLMRDLGISESDIYMILDFRNINQEELSQRVDDAVEFLANNRYIKNIRKLYLAASGFPENMGKITKNSSELIPRTELELWERVSSKIKKNKLRSPTFSDYGICHPDLLDFDLTMNPSANIRYTVERNWLIVKGAGLKQKVGGRTVYNYDQFYSLAEKLASHRNYYGQSYSFGDLYIYKCSQSKVGPGNLPKWREVGTNHHITLVAQQIASCHAI